MKNREELAWAAGLFDGEGHVRCNTKKNFQLIINQVDRRVLDRFAAAVGVGTIYGPLRRNDGYQSQYRYNISDHTGVQAVCAMLWTWLSPVKREQFHRALTARPPKARSPLCEHGLRWTRCLICWPAYAKSYRASEKGRARRAAWERQREQRTPNFKDRERERVKLAQRHLRLVKKTAAALLVAS